MRIIFIILIAVLASSLVCGQCLYNVPSVVDEDTEFCSGNISIPSQMMVLADNIEISCNGSVLECSDPMMHGFLIENRGGVSVNGCHIKNCQNAIYVKDSSNIKLIDNFLEENKIGIALEKSSEMNVVDNLFERNQDSIYSLNSDVESGMIFNDNDYDIEPKIIGLLSEGEDVGLNISGDGETFYFELNETVEEILEEPEEVEEEPEKPRIETENVEIDEEQALDIMKRVLRAGNSGWSEERIEREAEEAVEKYFEYSKENIKIKRTYEQQTDKTKIIIRVEPVQELGGISIYEFLPKCLANNINELRLMKGYEVIESDPLMVWHFDSLEDKREITYEVDKDLSEECKELIKTLQMVDEIEGKYIWLKILGIIAVLGVIVFIVLFFQKFAKVKQY